MMRRELFALAAAGFAGVVASARILHTADVRTDRATNSFRLSAPPPRISDDSLVDAAGTTVTNDPFRIANHPAAVRFSARNQGGPPPTPAPRPTMTVQAIIGGPPWQAVIDGLPGAQPGTIVQAGSRFDKLVVRSVDRDAVTVQGPDTTWKLPIKRDHP